MASTKEQFIDAFEKHSDELFRHATMRLSDRERAVEITQETYLRAWDYVRRGTEVREMRAFLFKTLRNLIIDEYRKHKSHSLEAMIEVEAGESIEAILPKDETNTLEAAMERHEGVRALEALKDLPEPYREALALRYIDGLSPREIADIVGESENVVSVRVHRGLKKLRTLLEPGLESGQ